MAEALENVREALELHFEGLVADGEPLPQAQEVDVHAANPDYAGGVWALVDFDVTAGADRRLCEEPPGAAQPLGLPGRGRAAGAAAWLRENEKPRSVAGALNSLYYSFG